MFQALSIMELPPDPHNNPHRDRQDEIFRSGIQPIISQGDDATLGKRKASLTADESAKAQRIASIEQGLYIYDQWKNVQPDSYFMESNRPQPIHLRPRVRGLTLPHYYQMEGNLGTAGGNFKDYRTETQRAAYMLNYRGSPERSGGAPPVYPEYLRSLAEYLQQPPSIRDPALSKAGFKSEL